MRHAVGECRRRGNEARTAPHEFGQVEPLEARVWIAKEKKANPIYPINLGALIEFYFARLINDVYCVFVSYTPICLKPPGRDAVICLGVSGMTTPWTLTTEPRTDIVTA